VKQEFDGIVIGAGAAGLMCAIEAGKRGRRVVVLDHAERIGKKILISGGGRCNFTNLHCRPESFLSANPHFAKSALARYTPADFIALVERYRIPYHEKTLGQLFCDRSAQDILSMLEEECRRARVQIVPKQQVKEVSRPSGFVVRTSNSQFYAPALVIAAGGLSIPKIGATSLGYDVARQFGLKIVETRPALVPFVLNEADRKRWCDLAGVATEVIASADHQDFREKMLITHRGLSGPAILQISSYWRKSQPVTIDVAPGYNLAAQLKSAKRDIAAFKATLRDVLPHRLADRYAELHSPAKWTNPALEATEQQLHQWQIVPEDTEGYAKAEVTAGGVNTNELSARTMESRRVPGLYFIGEVVDVTGHLGGFNFQWAWASGFSAGSAV
jgi:predicted Rossmann fold flavoprotein